MKKSWFTLIELMVVIAVIGILAGSLFPAYNQYIDRANKSRANTDLRNLQKAILQLAIDTWKWPLGCPINKVSDPEANLSTTWAWLLARPIDFTPNGPCQWTSDDNWGGPYINSSVLDPWKSSYYFDTDYIICVNSVDIAIPAIVSFWNNKVLNYPNCAAGWVTNDVYIELQS
jgi:prepilin-type N-terminal cleavage/methylation domain-containing protein